MYRARDTKLDRTVALKILPPELAKSEERRTRFLREAKAASAIDHPNVVHIYEIGEADGVHFIAMQYVDGANLAARVKGDALNPANIINIGLQTADALAAAHAKGIVHRDIKPANLVLTDRDQIKVLDFGLAKYAATAEALKDSAAPTEAKTAAGMVMGTVHYMSPEQGLGRDVDGRSDIFSLGVVLYELTTGRLPFSGGSPTETIERIAHAQPDAIARFNYDAPPELERIIRRCLEKDPEDSEAISHLEKAVELDDTPYGLGNLGHAYAKSGRVDEAHAVLERLEELANSRYVAPLERANVYAGLGRPRPEAPWLWCTNRS